LRAEVGPVDPRIFPFFPFCFHSHPSASLPLAPRFPLLLFCWQKRSWMAELVLPSRPSPCNGADRWVQRGARSLHRPRTAHVGPNWPNCAAIFGRTHTWVTNTTTHTPPTHSNTHQHTPTHTNHKWINASAGHTRSASWR
jgi:hypothetical protein